METQNENLTAALNDLNETHEVSVYIPIIRSYIFDILYITSGTTC